MFVTIKIKLYCCCYFFVNLVIAHSQCQHIMTYVSLLSFHTNMDLDTNTNTEIRMASVILSASKLLRK